MKTILLDNGHGGVLNGVYQTSGKRSPMWNDGTILYEGEYNRAIVNGVMEELTRLEIPYVNIAPELTDTSLTERVKRANKIDNSVYVSIHSNAGPASAHGFELFTYHGESDSDKYATIFARKFQEEFPTVKFRSDYSDGDIDKESSFYVLRHTNMPAVLLENFFMTNEHECREYLMSSHGRKRVIRYIVEAIKEIVFI